MVPCTNSDAGRMLVGVMGRQLTNHDWWWVHQLTSEGGRWLTNHHLIHHLPTCQVQHWRSQNLSDLMGLLAVDLVGVRGERAVGCCPAYSENCSFVLRTECCW